MKILASLAILSAMTISSGAFANISRGSEGGNCPTCSVGSSGLSRSADDARSIRNTVSTGSVAQNVSDIIDQMEYASSCHSFAKGNSYGAWGEEVVKLFDQNQVSELERGSSDLKAICPGYAQMSLEGKKGVWVLILAAMAFHESSCNEHSPAHSGVTKGRKLAGLLQLDINHEDEYGGGASCKGGGGAKSGAFSARCSLGMLNNQVGSSGQLFINGSTYWQVLHPNTSDSDDIQKAIRKYNLCR